MDTSTLSRTALLAPLPVLAVEPFTAAAYLRTEDGASDNPPWVEAWSGALVDALPDAFTWASAQTVYLTYGKVQVLMLVGAVCGLLALRRSDAGEGGRFRWAWVAVGLAYGLMGLGVVGEYFTPWHDQAFLLLAVPGLLLTFVSSPFLGVRLLRQRLGSRAGGWLLALTMPGVVGLTALTGHFGFGVLWVSAAWALHARTLLQPSAQRAPALV